MLTFNFVQLYVKSAAASAAFYEDLLGQKPMLSASTFAMLPLRDTVSRNEGMFLGLWARNDVQPEAAGQPGASEIAFVVETADTVQRVHAEWCGKGIRILQPPTEMDFGTTFTATDPDGHRIRVFSRRA
jgi:predicted enzyme related to lactoylglutathione lyase